MHDHKYDPEDDEYLLDRDPEVTHYDIAPQTVRITLDDLGDHGTQLTYRNQGSPPAGRAGAIASAWVMFDVLAAPPA